MSKYNEVMSHVHLNEAMEKRILSGIEKKYKSKQINRFVRYASIAASVLLIVTLALLIPKHLKRDKNNPLPSAGEYTGTDLIKAYANTTELSEAYGYSIEDLQELPFEPVMVDYIIQNGVASIKYHASEDEMLIYGIFEGEDDKSGCEWPYDFEKTITVNGIETTIKGQDNTIIMALWKDGKYTRFVFYENGFTEEELAKIIK